MNYFPITGGSGSNLKYYVDGVQKKLKGYKVYKVPPILYHSDATNYGLQFACACDDGIHYFVGTTHLRINGDGVVELLNALPRSTKSETAGKTEIYECNGKIYLISGWTGGSLSTTYFYLWNPTQDVWTSIASLSYTTQTVGDVSYPVAGTANGNMYVVYKESSRYSYVYKFNDTTPHFERVGSQLPNDTTRPYFITGIDGKLCVLYSSSAYYLEGNTWVSFALSKYPPINGKILTLDGNPCFDSGMQFDSKRQIYEMSLSGLTLNREIEGWSIANNLEVVFDGKIHALGRQSSDLVNTYGYSYSHIMFDDDGKAYFQTDRYTPVMIPIFE